MNEKLKEIIEILKQRINLKVAAGCAGLLFLIIGGIVWVSRPNPKIILAAKEVMSVAEEIRKFYRNRPGYWGLNTESVLKNNLLPASFIQNGKTVNALGKNILIGQGAEGNLVMPGARSFDIVFADLDKKECEQLAEFQFTENQSLGLLSITIINNGQQTEFSWGGENKLPITAENARRYCGKQTSLLWTFE
ncbi:MAG: hypothetical protein J6A33_04035 [Alphaproteobacteria bacterium]|nr:hypothetical protein [Alphaproteobacteria bacterium]